jgi:hypothetical protein
MLLSDYIFQVQELVHDSASIDYTTQELTAYINDSRNQIADDFWCVRTYYNNLSAIVNQETYPIASGVGGARVTAGGVYAAPPTVTFGPPPLGGTQATGVAIMGGIAPNLFVQQIAMTNWGLGYAAVPAVSFGSGSAAATAMALLNVIDIYTISSIPAPVGPNRQMLLWEPFARFNAIYRMNTTNAGRPTVWSGYNEQNLFYLYPANPDQNYLLEIDAFVRPFPLVSPTDVDIQVNAPMNDLVQYWAAHKALLKAQNFEQAEYYAKKYEVQAKKKGASRFAPRRPNIYQNVWRRTQRGY